MILRAARDCCVAPRVPPYCRAMTLIIAAVDGPNVWMIADAAISGGDAGLRQREYELKAAPSRDGLALLGFSGDHHHGTRLMSEASSLPAGPEAANLLLEGHREYPSVDFAYAYAVDGVPHLIRISQGEAQEIPALYLGGKDAFEHFQRIQHSAAIDYAPEAIKTFVVGSRAPDPLSDRLPGAITSMLRLFAERSERDVGGWVTPYFLSSTGAFLCGYGYAVSDPILTKIGPGSEIPHGTAEEGGFGLSVTELGHGMGVVVYWLQQPGGTVFVRRHFGYEPRSFDGRPSEFIECASASTGQQVELFFSDEPHGPPQAITVMRDENGVPSMAIARHGNAFSISVLNVAAPFRSRAALNLTSKASGGALSTNHTKITFSDDRRTATLELLANGRPATQVALTVRELDALIGLLGETRWMLQDAVSAEPRHEAASRELMVLDPAWRTEWPIHPSLNGLTLRLRHPGFGWLTFLLPWNEARALGEWLVNNSNTGASLRDDG
jgi:hypothetical protein